jgi:hypothetical protein
MRRHRFVALLAAYALAVQASLAAFSLFPSVSSAAFPLDRVICSASGRLAGDGTDGKLPARQFHCCAVCSVACGGAAALRAPGARSEPVAPPLGGVRISARSTGAPPRFAALNHPGLARAPPA